MRILIQLCLLGFLIWLASHHSLAATPVADKPSITDGEFLQLFQADKTIQNRNIHPSAIISAIRWAQEEDLKKNHSEIPTLQIDDCVIEEPLVVNEERIPMGIHFYRTHFKGGATFYDVVFNEEVEIHDSVFESQPNTGRAITFRNNSSHSMELIQTEFHDHADFSSNTFQNGTIFEGLTFKESVDFGSSRFSGFQFFSNTNFGNDVNFNETSFKSASVIQECSVGGLLAFYRAKIEGTFILQLNTFRKEVYFNEVNKTSDITRCNLYIVGSHFQGRLYLTNARLNKLSLVQTQEMSEELEQTADELEQAADEDKETDTAANKSNKNETPSPKKEDSPSRIIVPTVADKAVIFAGLTCNVADFTEAEFHDYVDFSRARFATSLNFSNTSFEEAVDFRQTEFPRWLASSKEGSDKTGVILDGIRFRKPLNLDWAQVDGRVDPKNAEAWRTLEAAFTESGNLEGQNESLYKRRSNELSVGTSSAKLSNGFHFWYWGFGVRPVRPLVWLLVSVTVFARLYWTQTRPLAKEFAGLRYNLQRLRFAFYFSLRTAWSIGFGLKNTRTKLFKGIALTQSILSKVMFIAILKAFSNTSPLLNDLFGKLIHL